jgi:hypothetical protein
LPLSIGAEGFVRLYAAEDLKQLAEGTFFHGAGKKAWMKSLVSFKLQPGRRYLVLVFIDKAKERNDKYYFTSFGTYVARKQLINSGLFIPTKEKNRERSPMSSCFPLAPY